MSMYIKVDDAVNALCKGCGWYENQCDTDKGFWCESRVMIDEAPSIDIVFCKECRWWTSDSMMMICGQTLIPKEDDDFCSWGEREGE